MEDGEFRNRSKYDDPNNGGFDVRHQEQNPQPIPRQKPADDFYKKRQLAPSESAVENSKAAGGAPTKLFSKNPIAKKVRRTIFKGSLRGKTSLITIILVLFGGAGLMTIMSSPIFAVVQFKELLAKDLNDQLAAYDSRQVMMLRAKLKQTTQGSCGAIKIKCKFNTMSERQVKNLEASGRLKIDLDKTVGFGSNRGRVKSITLLDDKGNATAFYDTPEKFADAMKGTGSIELRSAITSRLNPTVNSINDPSGKRSLSKLGVRLKNVISGSTKEARQRSLNSAIENKTSPNGRTLTPITNDRGETTGYTDDTGKQYTSDEVNRTNESASRIASSGGTMKVLQGAALGASVVGTIDASCTIYNTSRAVSTLAKTKQKADAARFAAGMILTPADSQKAGVATEEMMTFVGDNLSTPTPQTKVVDESKWTQPGSGAKPPVIDDPDTGKNAYDSAGYHLAAYGTTAPLSARDQRLMIGGGMVGSLDVVNQAIATVVNGGDPDPKQVSEKCGYVQNPFVRTAALGIGILAGAGTLGLFTVASIAGSTVISLALPLLEARLADMIKGEVYTNLEGQDSGSGGFVGTAAIYSQASQDRGMKALSSEEAFQQQQITRQANARMDEVGYYMARSTPFDIMNRYSFLGSIAYGITPTMQQSKKTVASAAMGLFNSFSLATSIANPNASAATLSQERFEQSNDQDYIAAGIGADMFGNVRFGMSREEMEMDSFENIDWLVSTGNIDPNDESGAAVDNGQPWNFVKFLETCVGKEIDFNYAPCRSEENEPLNKHFRVFHFDKGIDEMLDAENKNTLTPGEMGANPGEEGELGVDGWAYPTAPEGIVTSDYKTPQRPTHRGVDIALRSSDINAAMGKPIFAARDGDVVAAGPADGFGNWIIIQHTVDGRRVDTVYGHMYDDGVLVKVGQKVTAGQQIGKIGSNGQSTGAHLHFEVWEGGRLPEGAGREVNPNPALEAGKGNSGSQPADDPRRRV